MTTTTKKYTITDIKAINAAKGQYFFERSTMRFFNSKVERGVYQGPGGVYFVTSEQFVGTDGRAATRKYTVRVFYPESGGCSTVGRFNEIRDVSEAKAAAKEYAKSGAPRGATA